MASRTSWEGYLRLNLLSVPVKAYNTAISGGGRIGFHMIHAECHSRIRYEKVCPVHGEVPDGEIVKAFEFAKGQYVAVDDAEREKLLPEDDDAITIDTFIRPDDLDPIYYGDRSYYLVPDGRVAEKPYAVLQRVMAERGRYAVAQMVLSGRGQVVLVRPVDGLLAMTVLNYDEQIKKPAEFADDVPDVSVAAKELELAESLVDASTTDRFDFSEYKDEYTEKLTRMLEAKSSGKKVVRARRTEEPAVLNLMDALRQSLARTKPGGTARGGGRGKKAAARPKKSAAPRSRGGRPHGGRRADPACGTSRAIRSPAASPVVQLRRLVGRGISSARSSIGITSPSGAGATARRPISSPRRAAPPTIPRSRRPTSGGYPRRLEGRGRSGKRPTATNCGSGCRPGPGPRS